MKLPKCVALPLLLASLVVAMPLMCLILWVDRDIG